MKPNSQWEERFDKEFFTEKQYAIKKEVVLKTTGDPGVTEIMNILIKDQLMISETQLKSFIAKELQAHAKEQLKGFSEELKALTKTLSTHCIHEPMKHTAWKCIGCGATVHPDGTLDPTATLYPVFTDAEKRHIDTLLAKYTGEEKVG